MVYNSVKTVRKEYKMKIKLNAIFFKRSTYKEKNV